MEFKAEQFSDRVQILTSSIVLIANEVNVSIFKLSWLIGQGIISAEELSDDVVITAVSTQVRTETFELTIVPNRIQLNLQPSEFHSIAGAESILVKLLNVLPHTPVSAIGLNVVYMITCPEGESFTGWTRSSFSPSLKLDAIPKADEGTRFGTYLSWDVLDSRLKLDIKPTVAVSDEGSKVEFMQAGFNYHIDLPENRAAIAAIEAIEKWNKVKSHSLAVVEAIAKYKGEEHGI